MCFLSAMHDLAMLNEGAVLEERFYSKTEAVE